MKLVFINKQGCFFIYLVISLFVSAFNIFFVKDMLMAAILVAFEILFLLVSLLKKNLVNFLALYTIFISNCIEFSVFLGSQTFFNLKNFRFLGVNLGVWVLLPAVLFVLLRPLQLGIIKNKFNKFYFFTKYLLFLNLLAALVGLLLILIDDNHITTFENVYSLYIQQAYQMLFLPLSIGIIMYHILLFTPKDLFKLAFALEATLWGCVFQLVLAWQFNLFGTYGLVNTLLASNITFLIPFIILLTIDAKHMLFPKMNLLIGIVGTVLLFMYNPNGKHFFIFLVTVIALTLYFIKSKSLIYKIITLLCVLLTGVMLTILIPIFSEQSVLFNSKYNQALSLISIFSNNWFSNLPSSPKTRIVEIINVIIEFLNKPWLFITGKGYMGSIRDHLQMFTGYMGAFSYAEWINNIYFNLHEIATQL